MLLDMLCVSIAVAVGIIVAFVVMIVTMFNKKVLKWYSKKAKKMTEVIFDEMDV